MKSLQAILASFLIVAAPTAGVAAGRSPAAAVPERVQAAVECAALQKMDFSKSHEAPTSITSAQIAPASGDLEEYCEVQGVVAPQIGFTLRLPTKSWNGRYFQVGCGGLCGMISIERCADAQAKGFAVAANNMGHVGHYWTNAMWADVPQLKADYGKRSSHVVAVAAKTIVTAYYGRKPAFSYFRGCSTGGREGLSLAQNFPGDFDGIIAGDPAFPVQRGAFGNNWGALHLLDRDDREIFTPAKLALLHRAVLNACDGLDGLRDGILSDPRRCRYPPERLACPGATDRDDCLNRAQVAAAKALYGGPRNSSGQLLTPGGVPYGSELTWRGTGDREVTNVSLQHLVFSGPRPGMTYRDFNWDTDVDAVRAQAALLEPYPPGTDPDLSRFHARGGKLIAYHGWADGIPPTGLLDYYARVHHREGGLDATRQWFRVFMVPGMYHCRGGDAPNTFDMLPAMIDWVERGQVPDAILATQYNEDQTVKRTRPLYAYPTIARYSGSGDVNDAASWRPEQPKSVPDDRIDWIWAPKRS